MTGPQKQEAHRQHRKTTDIGKQLPYDIQGALEAEGIHLTIQSYALADLSLDDTLGRGAAILTADEVWAVELEHEGYVNFGSATEQQRKSFFGRNRDKVHRTAEQALSPGQVKHLASYPLASVTAVRLENEVVGGTLILTVDETERMLLRFSGSQFKAMNRFAQDIRNILETRTIEADTGLSADERAEKLHALQERITEAEREQEEQESVSHCPSCGRRYPEEGRAFCPHCLPRQSVFKRLLQLFTPYKWRVVVLFLMIGLSSVFNALIPWLSGTALYDLVLAQDPVWLARLERFGIPGGALALLILLIITLMLTRLLQQVTGVIHGRQTAHMVPGAIASIKRQAFDALQKLSLGFFMRRQTGSLMQRINGDAEEVTQFFIDGLPYLLFNVLTMVATAFIMFRMNWMLAILSLFLLPPLFILSVVFLPRVWRAFGRRARSRRSVFSVLNDSLTGARVVRAFGQEAQLNQRFDRSSGRYRDAEMNIVTEQIRYNVPYSIASGIPSILVWTVGALIIINQPGALDFGQLVSFSGYLGMLQGPIQFFSMVFIIYSQTMNAAQRMFEIIDARPEITEIENPIETELTGEIELRDVTFAYDVNKPVLRDINFHVRPGEMLGIVGKSGAGKSTLVNLIGRLYDVDEGQILLDGHDIRELSFESLHGSVAMVSQETYIFMGTIAENIAYARPEASMEEIIQAAMAAAAHDFIAKLPDGYDTHVGTGGRQLSGGERQRVSIARAILADPNILVLDEATASVDTETERQIQDSLDELTKGRTTLSIAHRLSTLRNADRIIVLENGRLTESGTHQELEAMKGEYHSLMELQKKALALRAGTLDRK